MKTIRKEIINSGVMHTLRIVIRPHRSIGSYSLVVSTTDLVSLTSPEGNGNSYTPFHGRYKGFGATLVALLPVSTVRDH